MRLPLALLEVFDAITREGSLRAAAQSLGLTPSTVSHQLKSLEERLGAALFIRTTRSVRLTEAGRALAQNTGPAFEQLGAGLLSAQTAGHSARGRLKLSVPEFAYFLLLQARLPAFQQKYPEIEVELSITDALSDILEAGFHAGFRLGGMVAQDMVAKQLTPPLPATVVANPDYLSLHGAPQQPDELLLHNCLRYRFNSSGQIAPWGFTGPEGHYAVEVKGNLIASSLAVTLSHAEHGQGLAYGFRDYCLTAIKAGRLVEVLQPFQTEVPGINIYYPVEYRSMVPLRLLIEHLQQAS